MRKKETRANQSLMRISPWVIAGSFIIMAPILAFMTIKDIQTQQANMIMLLTEKGAALIRSFEAGTRTGMGMNWSGVQVQRLIMETAEQPDILYILITDQEGKIVAHNLPMNIGKSHGAELDFTSIKESIQARQLLRSDGKPVFEVYRRFIPSQGRAFSHGRMMSHDWFYSYMFSETRKQPDLTIFLGLDMDPIVETNKESASQSIVIAIILLLLGLSGIISIIIAQNYRSARASLSRIKAFSDNIVENMPVGLLFIGDNGKIMTINDASEKMLMISHDDSVGRPAGDLLPPQIVDLISDITGEQDIIVKEIQCTIHGKTTMYEASAGILKDDENTFLGHIILLRDISEIAHLKKEVQQRERLASLGSLAAGIAHEIRNPLSSIKGFATYFKERYRDVPEDQKTADVMIREVERLNRVIGQLLEFARPMNVQRKEICVNDIVNHTLDTIISQAVSENISIKKDGIPKEAVFAFIDPDKLGQVLLNIFLNALEAMEGGGTLSVSIEEDKANDTVSLHISDTGHGIPREDISRIFDPYYTTKQSGTGLGLAIVHKIVEAHSAQIQVQSTQGTGTRFTITLPAHKKV
ncbi:MAG: PAS domain-containing protein [Deltaproteobacteria bacterium]|nr:PAS domain-containing protein [Deltaproteobacteria bacterium]